MAALHEELLPVFDNSDEMALVVNADMPTTWRALLDTDLLEVGKTHRLVGVLGAVRMLPELALGLVHGDLPDEMPESMRLEDLGDVATGDGGWAKLGERDGTELAFGLVGKFWKPVIEYRSVEAADFTAFDEPGIAKTVYAFKLAPAEGGTLLTAVMRTATTDEHARGRRRRDYVGLTSRRRAANISGIINSDSPPPISASVAYPVEAITNPLPRPPAAPESCTSRSARP